MKVAVVLGTRPEIIKMSPVLRALERRGEDSFVLHTGQHYSYEMDRVFFEQLRLPAPKHNLDVGSGTHGAQTGRMLEGVERVLLAERPDAVLVQGDTNTVLAGALAASKLHIRVGHVEAGLRSFDRTMPEELNRIAADHLSDLLFAPTQESADNLRREGIPDERVHVTGNTIADAVLQNRDLAATRTPDVLRALDVTPGGYALLTAHRQENVDNPARFRGILEGAEAVGRDLGVPVLFPVHPRARKALAATGVALERVRLLEPQDFLAFLRLEANARIILTDSGGVQEEACILRVPCVTLRDNSERPETIAAGANTLAGADPARILDASRSMLKARLPAAHPYGDGRAAEQILKILGM